MRTWIYRVAHHVAASHVIRERRIFATLVSLEELEKLPDKAQPADKSMNLERLSKLIQQLKPLDRQVIVSYLEDMDAASIGEITGLSPANVAMRIHRIKNVLARGFMREGIMGSNSSGNDPKAIWRSQPTEPFKMPVSEIRRKAEKLKNRARISALSGIVSGLLLFVMFGGAARKAHELLLRIGWGMVSLGSLFFAIQSYRWIWPSRLPEEISMRTSLESYRSELERQSYYGRNVWLRSGLLFVFLGIAIVFVPVLTLGVRESHSARVLLNAAPFITLLAIWFIAYRILSRRGRRKLQQEIDELNAIEKENQS
jgi:hypothetical protein